uniref:DUF4283 domain-containing protein n=1 Tax=Cannabis sativa TaxID=3483 RepID=A0A803QFA3_CANSA
MAWLVNGALLNIRDWPKDREWRRINMNEARMWVEAHGLPRPYLTWENIDVVAKEVGVYIDFDRVSHATITKRGFLKFQVDVRIDQKLVAGFYLSISRDRKEWIQFNYHKLPALFFNCGLLAHSLSPYEKLTKYAYPPIGNAVPLYDAWMKVGVPIRNFFDPNLSRMHRDPPTSSRIRSSLAATSMDKGK